MGAQLVQKAAGLPGKICQVLYSRVKTAVEYHIILIALWNSLQPIPDNIQTTLNFALTSCKKLMDFDEGGEDEELQSLVLTARVREESDEGVASKRKLNLAVLDSVLEVLATILRKLDNAVKTDEMTNKRD